MMLCVVFTCTYTRIPFHTNLYPIHRPFHITRTHVYVHVFSPCNKNKIYTTVYRRVSFFPVVAGREDVVRQDSRALGSADASRRTHEAQDAHQGW